MVRIMGRLRENAVRPLTRTDLRAAVASAAAGVKGLRGMKPVDIEVTLPEGRLEVLADELLVEIFNNLFLTALRSDRQDRPRLVVTADSRREGRRDMWWVKVSQPNKVIPDHLKAEVLRMAKAAKSELGGGFGIGLATSRGIAERYLGQMWVTDMVRGDPSKGCVYNITLPKA
jgi:signal transduction histidine kinase